jgi:hypothetical protein
MIFPANANASVILLNIVILHASRPEVASVE